MPHFYFHARGPGRFMPDYVGDDLPDAEWARRLALQAVQDVLSNPLDDADYSR